MKKLFSFEEFEEEVVEELEITEEEGVAAEIEAEVVEDEAELKSIETAIAEGEEAADDLEDVKEAIEESLDEEAGEGEGLSEESAQFARLAVQAICGRIGADPKAIYSLYSKENFASPSSRKANTQISVEAVGDFLKDLWERIKTAIRNMWKKAKDFWNKHLSNVARLDKAIKSMKKKVNRLKEDDLNKVISGSRKVPSSLKNLFPMTDNQANNAKGVFTFGHIESYASVVNDLKDNTDLVLNALMDYNAKLAKGDRPELEFTIKLGTKGQPLLGGKYTTIKVTTDKEDFRTEVDRETETIEKTDKDLTLGAVTKAQLSNLLDGLSVKDAKDLRKKMDKSESEYHKVEAQMNKLITGPDAGDRVAELNKAARALGSANTKIGNIPNMYISNYVKYARGVLAYVGIFVSATTKDQRKDILGK